MYLWVSGHIDPWILLYYLSEDITKSMILILYGKYSCSFALRNLSLNFLTVLEIDQIDLLVLVAMDWLAFDNHVRIVSMWLLKRVTFWAHL